MSDEDSSEEEMELLQHAAVASIASWFHLAATQTGPPLARELFPASPAGGCKGRVKGVPNVPRKRRQAEVLFSELTDVTFRRMHRMSREAFWNLLATTKPKMALVPQERKRGATPNGDISAATRLAMATRHFSGGSPCDTALCHGTNSTEVHKSAWDVVDAVHQTASLDIKFPESHDQQRRIAAGFMEKSSANLDNCVGATDGVLIWTHKPHKSDPEDVGFGAMKFFNGRKKKFGLNMQAICDSRSHFLHVGIGHPGASSDCPAFNYSKFKRKLETPGYLADGLVIHGDNAHTNSQFMVVPFKSAQLGTDQDNFNFCHSSLRIQIECAFGKLVHRWGILRSATCHLPLQAAQLLH